MEAWEEARWRDTIRCKKERGGGLCTKSPQQYRYNDERLILIRLDILADRELDRLGI